MSRGRGLYGTAIAAGASIVLAALPASASAHATELVGKQDLPIPRWLFGWGAAMVLVVSFAALATLWTSPRLARATERELFSLPKVLDLVCGALGVAAFVGLVYAGFAGTTVGSQNILPTTVFVAFWVGVPIVSALFGDVFRAFNPWRAVGRFGGTVAAKVRVARGLPPAGPDPIPYPDRLGYWPAGLGLLAFVFVELAFVDRNVPSTLAALALVYAAAQLVGMAFFGVAAWTRRGDAFAVYFGLFATLSPLRWTREQLMGRPPPSGIASLGAARGSAALLCIMIGSTSFDGFSVTSLWNRVAGSLLTFYRDLGFTATQAGELAAATGLLAAVLVIGALYHLAIVGMRLLDRSHRVGELARRFAPSLVPIALAYVIAHYFGLLVYKGQAFFALLSDPLGQGSDLFGTANASVDYNWVSATTIWYVQVGALIVGHAAGLVIAHDRALVIYGDARTAARSQYPMLAVMVAFTSLALYLLSALA